MLKYILKRLLWIIPVLIGVTVIVFTILYFSPGDPAYLALGDNATPEAVEAYRIEMGINGGYWERLGNTLLGLIQGDLGLSFRSKTPVINELIVRFKVTFDISAWSIVLGIVLGIFFGIISALKQNTIWDSLSTGCALFGISMPMFWQGLMLILIFSVTLNWLPPSGYGDNWKQMVLPVIALGVNSSATIMRTTRSSMLEVMRQDYIRTAKAKGQTYWVVVLRHALKNAMIPIVTVIGLQMGTLLAGSIVTEAIFSIAGVGKYLVDSMLARDYNAVQGCVLLIAFVSAILNLIVDIIYTFIDPRMKTMYESESGIKLFKRKGAGQNG
ncbi:Dipeptide transport system permease protein DppB [bioreactor metagenome]|uniref:Dipeptide transport system permease protein DppB n=1 Tax=bioreactor metagenome TaxID=1076179 RepID=A0A644Y1W8_9ZZZZ|nr:ABC transporter permease [Oscillibacter sp.]MEA4993025.1 ABC transporter permease [Oscillibacter sp.]